MVLQPMSDYGWAFTEGQLSVVWDTPSNLCKIRERVKLLLQGCKCFTGCTTGRCGCRKNSKHCAEGCQCKNCCSIPSLTEGVMDMNDIAVEEHSRMDNVDVDEMEELVDWVFGPEMDNTASNSDEENYQSS